jgi:hypothetical protein
MDAKKILDGAKLGLGNNPVRLSNPDQDIDQQKNKLVVTFGLGLFVAAHLTPDVLGKTPDSDNDHENKNQTGKEKKSQHIKKERGTAQGQEEQGNNQ